MNLVLPIASHSKFFKIDDFGYPKPLVEISGKPMIQHVIENLCLGNDFTKIIFVIRQDECDEFHLDNIARLLSPIEPEIIKLSGNTKGALCSVLFAIDSINTDESLVIANSDQIFDGGISSHLKSFERDGYDAGTIIFDSIHPRWAYIKTNAHGLVVEACEKNPISRDAIAGIYMYKKGKDFVINAMNSIKNGSSNDGNYFIAPVFNQYILNNQTVGFYRTQNHLYHSFFSPQKIDEYESSREK